MSMQVKLTCHESKQRFLSGLHVVITLLIVLGKMMPTSYKLLMHYKKIKQTKQKALWYGGIFICMITWIWILNDIIVDISCMKKAEFTESVSRVLYAAMYQIQMIILLLFFFLNIYYHFEGTKWKLSKLSLRLYRFIFFLICLSCVSIIVTLDQIEMRLSILLTLMTIILIFGLMISLMISYVRRLIAVYKYKKQAADTLVC